MVINQDLVLYYHDRAPEYDRVYAKTEEQHDLYVAAQEIQNLFRKRDVLEIACGTGHWTDKLAKTAASVFATDINQSMIDIARSKVDHVAVQFEVADMYHIPVLKKFNGLFGGFIWSHILLQDIDLFIHHLLPHLHPGAYLLFMDNKKIPGSHHDAKNITHMDEYGNTFQTRKLDDGTIHQVLKNFPTQDFLRLKLSPYVVDLTYTELEHYWMIGGYVSNLEAGPL